MTQKSNGVFAITFNSNAADLSNETLTVRSSMISPLCICAISDVLEMQACLEGASTADVVICAFQVGRNPYHLGMVGWYFIFA